MEALFEEGVIRSMEVETMLQADWRISPSRAMASWVRCYLGDLVKEGTRIVTQLNCPRRRSQNCSNSSGPAEMSSPQSLIFFGRLEERKGIRLFLDALEYMGPQHATVHFVGADASLAEGRASELVMRRLNSSGQIHIIHGSLPREEAHALLNALGGVVVIPSLIENSPYTVQELLDTELRVVATDVGGVAELVLDPAGRLSAPTPMELARHLQAALAPDTQQRYRLKTAIHPERIVLSWQAFHERLPALSPQPLHWPQLCNPPMHGAGARFPEQEDPASLKSLGADALLVLCLSSCPYECFAAAATPNMDQVGGLHRVVASANSFAGLLMGQMPTVPTLSEQVCKVLAKIHATSEERPLASLACTMSQEGYFTIGSSDARWFDLEGDSGGVLLQGFDRFHFANASAPFADQLGWVEKELERNELQPLFLFLIIEVPPTPSRSNSLDILHQIRLKTAWLRSTDSQIAKLLSRFSSGSVIITALSSDQPGAVPMVLRLGGQPIAGPGRWNRLVHKLRRKVANRVCQLWNRYPC
jgi:hypothetical protein